MQYTKYDLKYLENSINKVTFVVNIRLSVSVNDGANKNHINENAKRTVHINKIVCV